MENWWQTNLKKVIDETNSCGKLKKSSVNSKQQTTNSKKSMNMIGGNDNKVEVLNNPVIEKRGPGRPKTKMTLKRVVLLDGSPVGRGRPGKENKGERTVVFIPVNETYNKSVHGVGKKYIAGLSQYKVPIKRIDLKAFEKMTRTTQNTQLV